MSDGKEDANQKREWTLDDTFRVEELTRLLHDKLKKLRELKIGGD